MALLTVSLANMDCIQSMHTNRLMGRENDYQQNPIPHLILWRGNKFPAWYKENCGAVLSTTIDKYCYISSGGFLPFLNIGIESYIRRPNRSVKLMKSGIPQSERLSDLWISGKAWKYTMTATFLPGQVSVRVRRLPWGCCTR